MSTFILDAADVQASQLPLGTELAPTADVPAKALKGKDTPRVYAPCPACRQLVLTGHTAEGHRVLLDTSVKTYCVRWTSDTPTPALCESAAYPLHQCKETTV